MQAMSLGTCSSAFLNSNRQMESASGMPELEVVRMVDKFVLEHVPPVSDTQIRLASKFMRNLAI